MWQMACDYEGRASDEIYQLFEKELLFLYLFFGNGQLQKFKYTHTHALTEVWTLDVGPLVTKRRRGYPLESRLLPDA